KKYCAMHDDTDPDDTTIKSKSQRKREMHALQSLGEELVKLPKEQFEKVTLPTDIHDAIVEARNIRQHGAHKRQLQYIGKLMRSIDPEPIQQQLDTLKGQSAQAARDLHNIERWRDQLLKDGDQTLKKLLQQYPRADSQHIRQLLRNAQKEFRDNKPPKSTRALFRYLRDIINEQH
ncbi:ribosome biogenesis factor YjgA, partial [Kaarinaea lacus]